MPPKLRITREMILDTAFAIVRQEGIEALSARAIAQRLGCSTQPVLYQFSGMEEVRREVCRMADACHGEYLMRMEPSQNPMIAIGLNYIRFAREEKPLFRLLFQSGELSGQGLSTLTDGPELAPVMEIFRQESGLTLPQVRQVFLALTLLVHGWASMVANNAMEGSDEEIVPMLEMAFDGMVGVMKMEGMQE